jgi:peptide/nickel transport system permease protein
MKMPSEARLALLFCGMLVVLALFADFLSSNPPSMQNLDQFYHPPTRVRIIHADGSAGFRPFIYESELLEPLDASYRENGKKPYPLEFFFRGYPYQILGCIPCNRHLIGRNQAPYFFPLGTDELGRDVLARVLAGTRTSLMVVVLGVLLYALFGLTLGALAGIQGGWVDSLVMRFSEFVLALPALYLLLALRALVPGRIPFWQTLFLMVGTIAAVAWPPMARGVRGLILQLKNATYVEASRSLGATPLHIFKRHMLPSLLPFILTQLVVAAPVFLLGELVLSFLNVGFGDSGESWGSMLRSLRDMRVLTDFWWNLLPLCMIFLTLLGLNILTGRLRSRSPNDRLLRL